MNAPGSPSSPLQMTYLVGWGVLRTVGPFDMRGEPGPAPPAQAAGANLFDDLVRVQFRKAAPQGDETVVPQVFVQVERIDLAAVFGGQMFLRTEKRTDGRFTLSRWRAARSSRFARPCGVGPPAATAA